MIGEWVPVDEPSESDVIRVERKLLRQKDVRGEWVPVDEPGEGGAIWAERKQKWLRGLRWSNIDKNLILRHTAGSSGRTIEVDLRTAPMVLEELKIEVANSRTDPATLDEIFEKLKLLMADSLPSGRTAPVTEPVTTPVTLQDLIDGGLPCAGP